MTLLWFASLISKNTGSFDALEYARSFEIMCLLESSCLVPLLFIMVCMKCVEAKHTCWSAVLSAYFFYAWNSTHCSNWSSFQGEDDTCSQNGHHTLSPTLPPHHNHPHLIPPFSYHHPPFPGVLLHPAL